jgi:hypothetical protein
MPERKSFRGAGGSRSCKRLPRDEDGYPSLPIVVGEKAEGGRKRVDEEGVVEW